jgi:hypothetical protein
MGTHMQILQLEMHLKDQQVVRGALEKALGPEDDPAAAPPTLQYESPALKVPPSFTYSPNHSFLILSVRPFID